MNAFYKIIKEETILLKLKKKSDIGFWHYHILGLLSFFTNNQLDYLFITNKRILILIKDNLDQHTLKMLVEKEFPYLQQVYEEFLLHEDVMIDF